MKTIRRSRVDWMPRLIVLALLPLIGYFFVVYYTAGKTTAYGDAIAKINIARRVFDNPFGEFHLAQLGSIWLPMQSFLAMLTVWNDTMYHTAIAGSIWSIASYLVGSVFLYKLVVAVTDNRLAGLVSVLATSFNLNLIYFGTTPMTESLVVATTVVAAYALVKYEQELSWSRLAVAGVVLSFSCFIRYEFWYFVVFSLPLMWVALGRRNVRGSERRAHLISLYLPSGVAMLAWMILWEYGLMGNPLYFAVSRYSAKAIDVEPYNYAFVHNIRLSAETYIAAVRWDTADVILGAALLGGVLYVMRVLRRKEHTLAVGYLLGTPAFFVVSLFLGQNAIVVRPEGPYLSNNVRYGITILPLVGFGIGYLVSRIAIEQRSRLRKAIRLTVLIGATTLFGFVQISQWQAPLAAPILKDQASQDNPALDELAQWVGHNYDQGRILIESFGLNAEVQFYSGVSLHEYISEVNNVLWDKALADPANQVEWVVVKHNDLLDTTVVRTHDFNEDFVQVFHNEYGSVYVTRDHASYSPKGQEVSRAKP